MLCWKPTSIYFVFLCNAGDADAMFGMIHGSMGMAWAMASVPALLSWYLLEMHYEVPTKDISTLIDKLANLVAIQLVNETWNKSPSKLNCHLHPLDTGASICRAPLHKLDTSKGKVFRSDCLADNVFIQMNKLCYKDGKGDPRGFKDSWTLSIFQWFSSQDIEGIDSMCSSTSVENMFEVSADRNSVMWWFARGAIGWLPKIKTAQMHVLGLFGKLLSGPWMQKLYTSTRSRISHIEEIRVVKKVIATLTDMQQDPVSVLIVTSDFLGNELDSDDSTLLAILQPPEIPDKIKAVIMACVEVL